MIQYVPLFSTGFIPLVGPGGMFVTFVLNWIRRSISEQKVSIADLSPEIAVESTQL